MKMQSRSGAHPTFVEPAWEVDDTLINCPFCGLARIFHRRIEQRSGESVRRLDITQPNENATHRFFYDRL